MSEVQVVAVRTGTGWRCDVTVRVDASTTVHVVTVDRPTLERLAPGASDPVELVRASFGFLLERESSASILRSFDLPVIGRYFPEFEAEIRRRLG